MTRLKIDDNDIEVPEGTTVLKAAQLNGIYIPSLCAHPDLPPSKGTELSIAIYHCKNKIEGDSIEKKEFEGCKLCLVEVEGVDEPVTSCNTTTEEGMVVRTDTLILKEERKKNLMSILSDHPHACLTCAQMEGCTREPCSTNVALEERCCPKLGNCELQNVAAYVGIRDDTPKYVPKNLPIVENEPMFKRDYNLCIGCARCVRACRDLRGVDALAVTHDGKRFIVGTREPTLKESECKFCGACVEVCPTGALTDKDLKDKSQYVKCMNSCPVAKDIPRIIRLVSDGDYSDAVAVMREKVPFVYSLGNICFHPCQEECNRSDVDEAVAICALERFAASQANETSVKIEKKPPNGKRVAVVGSGPAGLTCAYYLSNLGYGVTVFESMPEPGGMLRYGIPEYRLPTDVLQKDLDFILGSGFELKLEQNIGTDITIESLKIAHDAVFLATGAQLSKTLNIEGTDLEGVIWGMDFLKDVRSGKEMKLDGNVVVIGGGNVAIDVALTAIRLGAKKVTMACLESEDEMPAFDWELEEARAEGVYIHTSWGPKQVTGENGKVKAVELRLCTSVFDDEGRFSPMYDDSVKKTLLADHVIFAIGQSSDFGFSEGTALETSRGILTADKDTLETTVDGIFAGGEVVSGPASVIDSIALGRKAASSIDKFFGGEGDIEASLLEPEEPNPWLGREEGFADRKRTIMPTLPMEERKCGFGEIELGFDEELAKAEAGRCLQCDLRLKISSVVMPPERWHSFTPENVAEVPGKEGVIQLLNSEKAIIAIKGVMNMRQELEKRTGNDKIAFFDYQEDPMYTKRESELIQQFLQKYKKMPEGEGGEEDLDDLF
jgi:NADPH-dependent glutamate synthase beta subunit-like oxidoreductase